jgi:hypothetical protein
MREKEVRPVAGWQTVLDEKLDLYRFWRSPRGEIVGAAFGESMGRVAAEVGSYEGEDYIIRHLREIEAIKCLACEPIYVAEEMMDLVAAAAESFRPEPLALSDLVTQAGFLVLPRPLYMLDRHGKRLSFRIVAWYPAQSDDRAQTGIHLSLYSHLDDEDDWSEEQEQVELREHFRATVDSPYMLAHLTPWMFGQAVPRVGEPGAEVARGGWWVPVQSLLRLMMQTIAERTSERPYRASRKRWAKERPGFDPYVTVVRLRRPRVRHEDGGEHEVEWAQRWIVSGHWRNQWFPSLNAHRQIWISPFVKGPEDKPLVIRQGHAYEFVK